MNLRHTLLLIGAQHPAWSSNPDDQLVRIFNEVTALAREELGAEGDNDDQKADWCSDEADKHNPPFSIIDSLTAQFGLTDIPPSDDGKVIAGFTGFVVPPSYIGSYNRVALSVTGRVTIAPGDTHALYASFSSIDDSGMTIHCPHETKEKALKRLAAFRTKVEEWHPFMPPEFSEWEAWARENGVTAELW